MKRADINALAYEILVGKGYRPAEIAWKRAELIAWGEGHSSVRVKITTRLSAKAVRALLEAFPTIGPPRRVARLGRRSVGAQLDIEDAVEASA